MEKLGRAYDVKEINGVEIGYNSGTLLMIKLPDSGTLRIMSRWLLLAMVVFALPSLLSVMRSFSGYSLYEPDLNPDGHMILPTLLRDLVDEGLIKKGNKGFIFDATAGDVAVAYGFLKDAGIDLLTGADLQSKNVVEHKVFDFLFATSFQGIQGIDNILKDSGLVISALGHDPSDGLRLLSGYKIVYLRRFESTVVALRKTGPTSSNSEASSAISCGGVSSVDKRSALKGLEDVYFEPPRRDDLKKKPFFTSRKIKFLPDLLKDPLDEYPRRLFISDDSRAIDWFYNHYPMRHQEFEVLNMEFGSSKGVSDRLRKTVRKQDYVVMKAEARVVEEMLKDSTLSLVDELFLECENQWQDGGEETSSKRPYWECLALYGKVRDEGIAVHQWWT